MWNSDKDSSIATLIFEDRPMDILFTSPAHIPSLLRQLPEDPFPLARKSVLVHTFKQATIMEYGGRNGLYVYSMLWANVSQPAGTPAFSGPRRPRYCILDERMTLLIAIGIMSSLERLVAWRL